MTEQGRMTEGTDWFRRNNAPTLRLTAAPIAVTGAVGSPVNPLAVF